MSEYITKEELRGLLKPFKTPISRVPVMAVSEYAINAIPAADVEPVVRCQKCKSWDKEKMFDGKCWCNDVSDHTESTFFCAHGKER